MFAALEHAPRHVDNDASLAAGPSSVSANPAGASARRRERMSTQAGRYLNDFAAVHGLSPTREQMETLLAGVKAMPGHDYYQMNHLKHWFYARRGRKHGGIAPVAPPVSLPPSTTLTAKQTSDLQKLIERTAVIDDALLDVWASLFSVQKTVIGAWLRDNAALPPTPVTPSQPAWIPGNLAEAAARAGQSVEQWRNSLSHEPAQHRLPTPAETVSPGPDSPLLTHSQIKRPLSRNATSHLPATMQAVSSPIVPTHSPVNLHASDPIRTAIIQGIKEGSSAPTNRHAKTAAEFNELWNRFEPKLTRVAQALDSSTRP